MMIQPGTPAPDFQIPDQNGETVSLSSFRGQKVVLYFYPRDNTPGCSREAAAYRDALPEFEALGEGKVLFNTSIGPGFDSAALEKWLDKPGTHFFCDTYAAAGPVSEGFFQRPNVHSPGVSAGRTRQAFVLLSKKVLANIETALGE